MRPISFNSRSIFSNCILYLGWAFIAQQKKTVIDQAVNWDCSQLEITSKKQWKLIKDWIGFVL